MFAPVILIIGTRPEGIKLLPLYFALQRESIPVLLCSTAQHTELLTEVFTLFSVTPDISFNVMRPGQDLFYVTQSVLQKTKELFVRVNPSLVVVQGDTTSGMAAALAAFYLKIPVVHVEAGLRTDDIQAPFPEEMNRRVMRVLSQYHFAPTSWATAQLLAEGVDKKQVFCVGNTVVDALRIITNKIDSGVLQATQKIRDIIIQAHVQQKKILLFTMHRRESFDGGVQRVYAALRDWLLQHDDVVCIYPYHPNPHIISALKETAFARLPNIILMDPLSYIDLVYVLQHAAVVATDSGGIQEEAVSLGKSVIVLREKTERIEAVWAGCAQLVGTDHNMIYAALQAAFEGNTDTVSHVSLFGDGYAAEKMVHILKSRVNFISRQVSVSSSIMKKRNQAMKTVCVLGLGYIGLPTSIVLSEAGYIVVGVDIDEKKVTAINAGEAIIEEPDLFEKLSIALSQKSFYATTVVQPADCFVIAVPTPFKEHKQADLSYVDAAIASLIAVLKKNDLIIIESTIPVGTTEHIAHYITQQTGLIVGTDIFIAHCPERVLPGNIFYELVHNPRIIGGIDQESMQKAKELYASFVSAELYLTDAKTAELIKLIENSSRDVQIAFAHQVASMARAINLDPYEVIELANKHPRVNILKPSSGVGGHCLAVDPWFLVESFPDNTQLIAAARAVNDARPQEIIKLITAEIENWYKRTGTYPSITLCGATYKPNVDDMRESPALNIIRALQSYNPLVCEPHISHDIHTALFGYAAPKVTEAIEQADIVVFLVAHDRFTLLDVRAKRVLDFCGIMHVPKKAQDNQEYYFWPASKQQVMSYTESHHKKSMIEEKGG